MLDAVFSYDSKYVATTTQFGDPKIWEISTGKLVFSLPLTSNVLGKLGNVFFR
jgi:hypothetical protein